MTLLEAPPRLACPPRFATPRNPERATLGWQVADMARSLGGKKWAWQEYPGQLMPWQQHVADVAFEVDDEGRLVYGEVVILVPRQSGKTILVMAKTLTRLVTMAEAGGEPLISTYVAQKRLDARRKFERGFKPILRRSPTFQQVAHSRQQPTSTYEWRLSLNNGSEAFELGTGSWWQIGVPDDSGGHGDTLDDGTIDEARFQETGEVEEGLSPAMITRDDAQLWVVSTPGTDGTDGSANSVYLWRKVKSGREACESGNHGRVAYFEWSAPDEANTPEQWGDPEVWRGCMPALGFTQTEARIRDEWDKAVRESKEESFRRSYLGQWPRIPVLRDDSEPEHVLGRDAWKAGADPDSSPGDDLRLSLDVSVARDRACFGVAGPVDAATHVEMTADYARPGIDWVPKRAKELQDRWGGPVFVAEKSPAAHLKPDLEAAGVDVRWVTLDEHQAACAHLVDEVKGGRIRHLDQPELLAAIKAAAQAFRGDSFLWSRRSSTGDICPLVAVTIAAWATTVDTAEPFFVTT